MLSLFSRFYPYIDFKLVFNNKRTIGSFFGLKDRLEHLEKSGVVYLYSCSRCNRGSYVGSTSRLLYVRVCAHRGVSYRTSSQLSNPEHSAIRDHATKCKINIKESDFRILGSSDDPIDLRILESLYIKKLNPTLNFDNSSAPLHIFLFFWLCIFFVLFIYNICFCMCCMYVYICVCMYMYILYMF